MWFFCGVVMLMAGFHGQFLRAHVSPNSPMTNIPNALESDRTLFSPVTDQEFEQCIETLEIVSGSDSKVGMDEFILFLEMYSGRKLSFEDFQELPTPYVLIFYTAACSFGDGCGNSEQEPAISLGDLEDAGAGGVLYMFCQSVKNVSAVQITLNFQFQIRHAGDDNSIGVQEILSGSEGSEIITSLQDITEEVLLDRFGCLESSGRNLMESLGKRPPVIFRTSRQVHRHLELFDQEIYDMSVDVCDYKVHAVIQTILPSGKQTAMVETSNSSRCNLQFFVSHKSLVFAVCMPHAIQGEMTLKKCALVSAEISVTAASLYQHRTTRELRTEVAAGLKEAFNWDMLSQLQMR
jgi:hypothetical protein